MKKTVYLCLCAIMVLLSAQKLKAQHIVSSTPSMTCYLALDSGMVVESGYVVSDSVRVYFGDGTWQTMTPFSVSGGTAYYSFAHYYGSAGTYTVRTYLYSAGAIVDSVSSTITWTPCYWLYCVLYNDVNTNCVLDGGDVYLGTTSTVEIDSAGVPIDTVTGTSYVYHIATGPSGTVYTFKEIGHPYGYLASCPTTGTASVTITGTGGVYGTTMGFNCDPTACLDNAVSGYFKAGLTGAGAHMWVTSSSCTATTATVKVTFSNKYAFSHIYGGASSSVSGNVLTVNLTGLSAANPQWLAAYFTNVGTLTLGDTVQTRMYLVPASGECDTTNNIIVSVDTIRTSYDPNNKSVMPEGNVTAGTRLNYTLNFENTGTATATNIHIMDTLSDNLDISTIHMNSSSALCRMILLTYGTHNVVKFDFPGINLQDSSHHGLCDGEVSFTINAKSTLAPGAVIDNQAGIYFDINKVVMTNPVENKIVAGTTKVGKVNTSVVTVYPNPVNDELNIKSEGGLYNSLSITNTMGQVITTRTISSNHTQVDVRSLPAGIYYVILKGESGVKTMRFEKL